MTTDRPRKPAVSGWCGQLGRPNHDGCRYDRCACPCHQKEG